MVVPISHHTNLTDISRPLRNTIQVRDDVPAILPPLAATDGTEPLLYPSSEPFFRPEPHAAGGEEEGESKEEGGEGAKGRRRRMRVLEMTGAFDRAAVAGVQVRREKRLELSCSGGVGDTHPHALM